MTRKEIRSRILDLLSSRDQMSLQVDVSEIADDTSLLSDVGLDSIQILELTVAIEESFGFSLESQELSLDLFDQFGELVKYVQARA